MQHSHKKMINDFRKRFFISLILTIPVLLFSSLIQNVFGFTIDFPGMKWVVLALATVIYFYGGWPFITGMINEIKKGSPGMMTLIFMAITVSYGYSEAVTLGVEGQVFYWELATLIVVMLLGHWIEMRSVMGASKALDQLSKLIPDTAHVKRNGEIMDVNVDELEDNDIIIIKPGEKIPADGIIISGSSYIDQSMLTGESKPVKKEEDQDIIAGAINGDGTLEIKIKNKGNETYLSKVMKLVEESQKSKSKTQNLANKAAFWLTIIALTTGLITLTVWLLLDRELAFALERTVTVMVITCPHALGLAIPLVVAVSTSLTAKNGLLIRNRTSFENTRNLDIVVFDKTGTLTQGKFQVTDISILDNNYDDQQVMSFSASLESRSEHPIAKAILKKASQDKIKYDEPQDFQAIKGKGIEGRVNGKSIKLLSPDSVKKLEHDIEIDVQAGSTPIVLLVDNTPIAIISLADSIREEAYDMINWLKEHDIESWMLTGDHESVAKSVAEELKLNGYFAEVLPDQKHQKISELKEQGKTVVMVGDGINDAPALSEADIGIAIGGGTDIAYESADIILVNNNLNDITNLIDFSQKTYNKMIQNLIWATAYNVVAIPLAAGVLYKAGIVIPPAIGALIMSISTIIVAINAQLLRLNKYK